MRVVGANHYGGPDALEVVNLDTPEPGPGEVRIRVRAAAVNPTDTSIATGARAEMQATQQKPYVPGMDAAGVLEAIGPDTQTDLRVGDEVMAIVVPNGPHGAYSEQLVLPAESVVRIPRGATLIEASTLPMNGLTARQALDILGLQSGQTLAVTGAAGAFGGYVVQLAKAEGLTVIADAAEKDEELVRSLGADIVVPRGPGFAEQVRAHFPDGVDGAADGALLGEALAPAVKDEGVIATVRGYEADSERGVRFRPVWVRSYAKETAKLDRLRELVESGAVTLRVADTLPLEHAGEAHKRLAAGGVRGRLVLTN